MSGNGNSANTAVWGGADVLIGSTTATIPVGNAAFTLNETSGGTAGVVTEWDYTGLLDGSSGFELGIEVESTDHEAWGFGVVATTYKGQKTSFTFTALEENQAVMGLTWDTDGMTFTDTSGVITYQGDLAQRDHTTRVRVAMVTYNGDTERRLISANYATVVPTNAGSESEEALQSKQFTVTVYPDSSGVLWKTYKGASL